jgi:TetR/AcrR family transcriptional regulator, ethionamide resistance regulator
MRVSTSERGVALVPATRKVHISRQDRRAAWEQRFLAATESLLRDGHKFSDLSVDRLASAAGTSRATFYVYFEDKGHMLRQLAQHILAELNHAASPWWDSPEKRDRPAALAALADLVATSRRHRLLLSAVIETAGYDERVAEDYNAIIAGLRAKQRQLIEQGQVEGTIRPMDADTVGGALILMIERGCTQLLSDNSDDDKVLARSLAEIIWSTLYLEPFER